MLERATELGRVLFSQDRDFLILAHRWLQAGRIFSGLVYAHQLNVTIGQAVEDLEVIAQLLLPKEAENQVYFLPL